MAPARASSSRATVSERLVLIPAISKRSTTGYKCVSYNRRSKKFEAKVRDGGKNVFLGSFETAEEAATAYARSEYGRADAAKLLQPSATTTAAGAAAILQAEREGLTLATSSSSSSGYKGVTFKPKERGSKKYKLSVTAGGKQVHLGMFATAEQAALFYARREAGRDTSDLTAPPPPPPPPVPSSAAGAEAIRQAEREGLTLATSSSSSGYKGVSFYPTRRGSKKYKLEVGGRGKQVFLGMFATAEQAALFYARREAGRDTSDLTVPPPPPPPPAPSTAAGAEAVRQAGREGLTLTTSSSSSGYKGVTFKPKLKGRKKYQMHVWVGGKQLHLGYFATAEEAALFYARREAGRDTSDLTAPPPPPPPPEPSTAAGAEAVRQAGREGLSLATSSSSNSGYKGVWYSPKERRTKKYQLQVRVGGKMVHLGYFATAEEAALARARHLWDTTVRLLEPLPQQAPPEGAAGPSEASSYEEEDGFDPTDIAEAVALSLLPDPPSASEQRAARRQARAAEKAAKPDAAATAAAQAAAEAASPWDDEVEVEAEQESDSEEESEMEVEAAPAVAGVSAATAAEEEALECVICTGDLSAHAEARLQPRDPNGWGATRCCKSLFHYRCLHTWLSDDSEVETSRGMEPINTACPGCRGFVSKSASRMLC